MAGDVTVAVVSAAMTTANGGTTDFTKSGFGTPKAAIILNTGHVSDGANVQSESSMSIGFSDFASNFCITHQDEDGSAKVDCDALKSNTRCYSFLSTTAGDNGGGTASTITDGVRLTNSAALSEAGTTTVIMFGGADLKVSLDSVNVPSTTGNTQLTTTGIDQDLVFFIGTDITGEDGATSGIQSSFGVAHIDTSDHATFVNRCEGWSSDHNNVNAASGSVMRNDRCLKILTEAQTDDWGIELTGATATAYTITARDVNAGSNMEIYALALDLDDRGSKIGSVDSPTSGTSWTPSVSLVFTPQYVGLFVNDLSAENTIRGQASREHPVGISSNTGSGEETCHSWYNFSNQPTTDTNNLFRSRVIDLREDDVSGIIQDHSHSSFNSGDWTYTINTENETFARKWFYWAIEEAAAAAPIDITPPRGDITLTGFVPTVRSSISVPVGTLTLTGFIPTAVLDFSVLVPRGDITLTGSVPEVDITANIEVTVPAGTITLTGFAPTVDATANVPITVPAGAIALTGSSPPLDFGFPISRGDIVLTGFAPTVAATANVPITVPSGAITLTGFSPPLNFGVSVPRGDVTLTGFVPTAVVAANTDIIVPTGTITIAGFSPPLDLGFPVPKGDITLAGFAPTVVTTANVPITVPTGAITITTTAPTAIIDLAGAVPAGAIAITGFAPAVKVSISVDVPVGAITITGTSPTLDFGFPVPSGVVTLTEFAPTVTVAANIPIIVPAGAITLTAAAPTALINLVASVPIGVITITGSVPVVRLGIVVPSGAITLTGFSPPLDFGFPIPSGAITISTAAPTVDVTANVPITVPSGAITLTGFVPTALIDLAAAVPTGAITITGFAPTVLINLVASVPAGVIAITGSVPALDFGFIIPSGAITISSAAPTVVATANVPINVPSGTITLTSAGPVLDLGFNIPAGTITITGFAPAIVVTVTDLSIIVPSGVITIATAAPSIVHTQGQDLIGGATLKGEDAGRSLIGSSPKVTLRGKVA